MAKAAAKARNNDDSTPTAPPAPSPATGAVRNAVLSRLGRPAELYRVDVLPLWDGHFRVNVLTGTDPTAIRIIHSYFVEIDANDSNFASTPPITRLYE